MMMEKIEARETSVEWEMHDGWRKKSCAQHFVCGYSLSGLNAIRTFAVKDGRVTEGEIQMRVPARKCGLGEVAAKTDN